MTDSDRSYEPITRKHLDKFADFAAEDRKKIYARHPQMESLFLCSALCQGAALHFVDGRNGVKDFDVYSFFARHPEVKDVHPKAISRVDFGASEFGRPADLPPRYTGRKVDLMRRSIHYEPGYDVADAIRGNLTNPPPGKTPWYLAQKAVVLLTPPERRGEIVWPRGVTSPA